MAIRILMIFAVLLSISSCALHFRKNENKSVDAAFNQCSDKKVVVNMSGLFAAAFGKQEAPLILNRFKGIIESKFAERGMFSIFNVKNYDPSNPYGRKKTIKKGAETSGDFTINYTIDLTTDETFSNWKVWVGGLTYALIPTNYYQTLTSNIQVFDKNNKKIIDTTYADDYESWYQLFFVFLVWTDTRSDVHYEIIKHHTDRLLSEIVPSC